MLKSIRAECVREPEVPVAVTGYAPADALVAKVSVKV
jgi:hypothetical protein